MAEKDEKGYIRYTQEELAKIPSFEQRDQGQGLLPGAGTTLGAVTGGVIGSAAGPAGTIAGATAGGLLGNQVGRGNQAKTGADTTSE